MMYVRPVHGAVALLVSLGLTAAACAGPSRPPVAAVTAPPITSDTPSPSPTPEPPTPTPDPPTPVVAPPPPPAPAPPPPVAPPPPPPRTIMPPAFNDRDRDNFGGPNDFDGNG